MATNERILGVVRDGRFHILSPERLQRTEARLTRIGMQVSVSPESEEIDFSPQDGQALMVEGHEAGDWIYSAQIVDEAGPILTAVVKRVFGDDGGSGKRT